MGGGGGGRYSILIIAGPDEQVTITKVLTASLSFIFTRWAVVFWVADALNVNAATTYWTRPLVRKARIMTCKRKINLISVNRLIIKELLVCPLICFLLLLWSIFLHQKKNFFVESARALLFPCVSSHWWKSGCNYACTQLPPPPTHTFTHTHTHCHTHTHDDDWWWY